MIFWVAAAVLAGTLAFLIMWRAACASRSQAIPAADPASAVYRRQLGELDELAARGVLSEQDRKSAFAEAARRLLDSAPTTQSANPAPHWIAPAAAAGAAVVALTLYLVIGQAGLPDQPFKSRLAHWRTTPPQNLEPAEMAAVLRSLSVERPADAQLQVFLGKAEMAANNPAQAVLALRRATLMAPKDAEAQSLLGQALVAASEDGSVAQEAEAAFRRAAAADPADLSARYFLGVAAVARGNIEQALQIWQDIRAELPAEDPRRQVIETKIAEAEGQDIQRGADADFIASMVNGLAARLQANPNDPEGWARLANAYAVLGRTTERADAVANARRLFADDRKAMDRFEAALRLARWQR